MQSEKFQDPNWYKALTLTERLDCFPEIRMQNLDNQNIKGKPNERLLRWREQSPFNVDNWFDLRLRSVGISQNEFKWILSQEPACFKVVSSKLPSWLAELSEAYTPSNSKNSILENFLFEFSDKKDYQQNRQNYEFQKFLILVEPLLSLELNQLNGALNELHQIHPKVLFNPVEVEKTIIASLSSDLLQIISRTLVLELNVARLNGILKGKTSSDRFEHFTNLLVNKDFTIQLLLEYPVLSKILVTYIKQTFQNCIEFITRLFEDWRILDTTFQLHDAYLTGLWPFGDRHKGGKSVIIATFSSRKKIVYKPRSLAVDAHFQALLNWFNNYYDYPLFKELGIIDQGEYGWVEFVEHKNCTSEIEIQRFYERLGAYLALLHMIDATDFHFENLIASGEYPVLIDLETLWHRSLSDQVIINKTHAEQIAGSIILNSVMR
ncbi:MAG: type 2 lanthipeptide synthetase LanM [Patescibacteria group bacterium]